MNTYDKKNVIEEIKAIEDEKTLNDIYVFLQGISKSTEKGNVR